MNASASSSATTHIVKPGTAAAKRVEATKKQQTPPKTNVPTGKPWKQRDSRQLIRQPYENESLNAEQSSSSQRNYIPTNRDNRYAERSPARAFQPRYDDREQAPYHSVPAYSSMPAPTPYTPVMPMAHAPVSAPLTMPYAPYGMAPMTAYAQPAQTGPMRAYNNANTVYTGYLDTQEDERYASPESYIRNAVRGRTHNRSERNVSDSEGRYQQHRQLAPEPAARTYTMSYSPPRAAPRALVQPWEI